MTELSQSLQDGFQEILTFEGHRLHIRGFNVVEVNDDCNRIQNSELSTKEQFISWDVKQILLWESNLSTGKPVILANMKFSSQPNFICSVIYIPKLKIFLAAALDMSFKIYDRHLTLLESIHHEERAILQLEYDPKKDILLSAGASGISLWKIYRNNSLNLAHILEKLYSFEGCSDWVNKMVYEPKNDRIYAIRDRSAQILSLSRRSIINELRNVHEAPLSVVCWYERNQFYITGCSRGEIKCWTSNYATHSKHLGGHALKTTTSNNESNRTFAMLHAFKGHTKAVTGIQLHPVSGLAITTSLDGFVKILNLEAMSELYCVNVGAAILELKVISLSATGSHSGIMFSLEDATIKLWRITSCCTFFSVCTSKISKLTMYENLQLENEKHHAVQQSILHQEKLQSAAAYNDSHGIMFDTPLLNVDDPRILIDGDDEDEDEEEERATTSDSAGLSDGGLDDDDEEDRKIKKRQKAVGFAAAAAAAGAEERILVGFSSQDLRAFTQKGALLGRFEPEHVVDGIKAYTVSVFQKLLFLLTDSDKVRVHDLKRYTCPMLKEHNIKGSTIEDSGLGTSCVLIDCIPINALRSGGGNKHHSKHDSRGTKITSPSAEEFLLVGMKNGAILFMDTLTDCEVAVNIQAHNGIICELKYRQTHKELFVLGSDFGEVYSSVRIFQLPQMELLHEVGGLKHISCFEISPVMRMFAIGNAAGVIRLFTAVAIVNTKLIDEPEIKEVVRHGQSHDQRVLAVCFDDSLKVYVSCSMDSTVKIWDHEKRLVRSVILNNPSSSLACNGSPGDIVVTQGTYLLTIPREYWDEGEALQRLRNAKDPWDDADDALAGVDALHHSADYSNNAHNTPFHRSSVDHSRESRNGSIDTDMGSVAGSLDSTGTGEDLAAQEVRGKRRASTHNHNLSFIRKSSVSFARHTRPTGAPSFNLANKLGVPVSARTGPSFVTQQRKRISIDDIENELLPKLQLQFIRSINNASTDTVEEFSNIANSTTTRGNFSLTNNDWTTLSQNVVVTANKPNDSQSIDVLHPRFLVHKKPTAKTFRFEDLNLQQRNSARQNQTYSGHDQDHDGDNAGSSRSDALSFADPNQYLARSGSNFSNSSSNERGSSADTKFRHRFSVSTASNSKQNNEISHAEPVVVSPGSRRSAQIGLSPRAQLTLLNSNEKLTSNAAREQQDQIIFATLGMRVSAHYKRHRESLHVRHEADFQETIRLHGAPPSEPPEGREGSFQTMRHKHLMSSAQRKSLHNSQAASTVIVSNNTTVPSSLTSPQLDLNASQQAPLDGSADTTEQGDDVSPEGVDLSPKTGFPTGGGRRRNNAQTVSAISEDELARLVEQKAAEDELKNVASIVHAPIIPPQNNSSFANKEQPSLISPNRKKNTIREDMTSRLPVALLNDENSGNINKHASRKGVVLPTPKITK